MRVRSRSVVVTVVLFLLLTGAPRPAPATGAHKLAVQGNITLGGGLSYPCLPLTGWFFTGKCPLVGNPNARAFGFTSSVCAMVGTEVVIGPPAPLGGCYISVTGLVTGWCGMASGHGSGTVATTPTGGQQVTYPVTFTFTVDGGALTGRGSVVGTSASSVTLEGLVSNPDSVFSGNSCATKTATNFLFVGSIGIVVTPIA